jgi:hypothetical protein
MSNHPLPWNKVRHALGHSLTNANGGLVAEAMTEAEVDAILAVVNKVPALVEAGNHLVHIHDDLQSTLYDPIAEPPEGGWKCGCAVCNNLQPVLDSFKT